MPGSGAMPKFMSGWLALSADDGEAARAHHADDCRSRSVAWKFAPVSASALSGMTPVFPHVLQHGQHFVDARAVHGRRIAAVGRSVAPEPHIIGAWVKMLQPPHEPEK